MTRLAVLAVALTTAALLTGCTGDAPERSEPPTAPSAAPEPPQPPGVRIGAPVWATRTSGFEVPVLQATGEGVLVVQDDRGGGEGFTQVLDADSGDRLWRLPTRVEDDGLTGTDYVLGGVELGSDASGRAMLSVPYERYTCRGVGDCTFRAGIEARDARTGEILWQRDQRGDVGDLVLGAAVTPEAVLVPGRGGVLGLDPATGERRWRAEVDAPGLLGDGVGISGPAAGRDDPYRVLDLTTGRVLRSVEGPRPPSGLVGSVLARRDGDRDVLEDVRTGEPLGVVGDGDVAPLQLASDGGLAWVTPDDRLLTLLPGETEPVAASLPSGLDRPDLFVGRFAGDVRGGVMVVGTDPGIRVMGREGALDDRVGPEAVTVVSATGGLVVLQVGEEVEGSGLALEVRPIL